MLTRRNAAAFPGDDPQPPVAGWPGRQVQNLHYTYDPAGNITHIQDDAQQTIYFRNQRVEPSNDYTYDALYRLIQATGREHLGQTNGAPQSTDGARRLQRLPHAGSTTPATATPWARYIERYVYDAVGNFLQMQHRGSDPAHPGWTRAYDYAEASLIEDGSGGAAQDQQPPQPHHAEPERRQPAASSPTSTTPTATWCACRTWAAALPGPNMHWDYKDQLRQTDLGGGGAAYYVYDASGQRVRKVWEKAPGLTEERIYLGGFEIFRKHGGPIGANTATLERETLHVMDDKQRIALVETRTLDTAGNDQAPRQLIRYQFGNHLGSASLELDEQAQIISYEEYAPYGSSTYQAVRSQTETPKRYRYTGKERDEESGLGYHGARYYAAWLGRWISSDPVGLKDDLNLYVYVHCSPVTLLDRSGTDSRRSLPQATDWNANVPGPVFNSPFTNVSGSHDEDSQDESGRSGSHKARDDLPASHPFNRHPGLSPLVVNIPDENKHRVVGAVRDIWNYPLFPISLPVRALHFVTTNLVNMAVDIGLGPEKGDPAAEELVDPVRTWGPVALDVGVTFGMAPVFAPVDAGMYVGEELITTEGGFASAGSVRGGLGVPSGGVSGSAPAAIVRVIRPGEKIADIVAEGKALTFETGTEHALVSLANGERVIVSGGPTGIDLSALNVRRLIAHSHPYHLAPTGPSPADFSALETLGQRSSYLLEHGTVTKFSWE